VPVAVAEFRRVVVFLFIGHFAKPFQKLEGAHQKTGKFTATEHDALKVPAKIDTAWNSLAAPEYIPAAACRSATSNPVASGSISGPRHGQAIFNADMRFCSESVGIGVFPVQGIAR
jgi:hypothetical protein